LRIGLRADSTRIEEVPMTMPTSVLTVLIDKQVDFQDDEDDLHLFATDPHVTTANPPKNFFVVTLIGDIVKVNDQHARGTYVGRTRVIKASPTPAPGGAIADVHKRVAMREHIFEILNASGRQIGSIMSTGFAGGECPPGTGPTSPIEHANWAIVGGTGAYLGARGQVRGLGEVGRAASMTEDPALRRTHPSPGPVNFMLRIIPMHTPEIMAAGMGPLIFTGPSHSLVTQFTPAIAGHNVSLFATGLGPTFPDVDLEQPFPLTPPSVVDSPVAVIVDGSFADHVHAVGIPGTVNGYQVTFKMPAVAPGPHPIRLTAAWIDGPVSTIWAG